MTQSRHAELLTKDMLRNIRCATAQCKPRISLEQEVRSTRLTTSLPWSVDTLALATTSAENMKISNIEDHSEGLRTLAACRPRHKSAYLRTKPHTHHSKTQQTTMCWIQSRLRYAATQRPTTFEIPLADCRDMALSSMRHYGHSRRWHPPAQRR